MKKIIYALIAVFTLTIVSCEGPQGPAGPQGPQGPSGESTQWKVINLHADANNWERRTDANGYNPFFVTTFDVPELDAFIYDSGLVQCYIEYDSGTSYASQQLLPSVRHKEEVVSADEYYLWTETTDFDYMVGNVNIYVTYSDFPTDASIAPGDMDFRLVLMW
ncbi:MAG: collagen-like protein [Paludibacteraceae bacterium]|nr:collagen-like protein [Paludibacteraceae bacterium]